MPAGVFVHVIDAHDRAAGSLSSCRPYARLPIRPRTKKTKKITTKILICHGADDPMVPPLGGAVTSPWSGETIERPPALDGLDHWAKFIAIVKGPRKIGPSITFKLYVRTAFCSLDFPSDSQKSTKDAPCFRAGPRAHKKRMDFGGFFACSVRSAMTRSASAVTFTSASCWVSP